MLAGTARRKARGGAVFGFLNRRSEVRVLSGPPFYGGFLRSQIFWLFFGSPLMARKKRPIFPAMSKRSSRPKELHVLEDTGAAPGPVEGEQTTRLATRFPARRARAVRSRFLFDIRIHCGSRA